MTDGHTARLLRPAKQRGRAGPQWSCFFTCCTSFWAIWGVVLGFLGTEAHAYGPPGRARGPGQPPHRPTAWQARAGLGRGRNGRQRAGDTGQLGPGLSPRSEHPPDGKWAGGPHLHQLRECHQICQGDLPRGQEGPGCQELLIQVPQSGHQLPQQLLHLRKPI